MDLLKPRSHPSFGRFEAIILGLYVLLSGWITYFHEPWSDEAQAWLIARDSSLSDLFLKRLHYEGTPGLWHLLLWIFCRLHISYNGMHWATVLIGVAAVYVLLRYAPFPPLVRGALPFTFPLIFQTAVIARSYSLVPLLVFLICVVLTGKRNRPLAFALLVGLLANTSLVAFMLAVGIVPLYLVRLTKMENRPSKQLLLLSGSTLALLFLFAIYTALPAPDISFAPGAEFASHPGTGRLLSEITGIPWPPPKVPVLALSMMPGRPHLADEFVARHFAGRLPVFIGHQFLKVVSFCSLPFFSVSQSNLLAGLFFVALLLWQIRHRSLIASLPLLALLIGAYRLGLSAHHTSVVATALILAIWLTWSRSSTSIPKRLDLIFQIILLAVLLEQIAWTAHATIYDIYQPFDGSRSAAKFILPEVGRYRVASIGIEPLSIQPYAAHNIYYNQQSTYWPWRIGGDPDSYLAKTVAQHPDFILDGEAFTGDTVLFDQILLEVPPDAIYDLRDKAAYLRQHGYRETHRFCGLQPAHFGFSKKTCEVVYQPIK